MKEDFKKKAYSCFTGLFVILLFICPTAMLPSAFLFASDMSSAVIVTVVPDTVLVGDRLHCTVTVRHSPQETAVLEGVSAFAQPPFELISSKHVASTVKGGVGQDIFELELALFGTGRQSLPSFTVLFCDTAGKVLNKVKHRSDVSVFAREVTDASMRSLRPIKPPLDPQFPFLLFIPLVAGVAGAGLLVLLLLSFLRHHLHKRTEHVDSGQVAQRKLRKLGSSLSAGMPPHECYEELSNIMRAFLETHYRISALEAVTQEIERDLKKLGVAGLESIMSLLRQADLVKFADSRPDVEESRQSLHKASEVIRFSRRSGRSGENE